MTLTLKTSAIYVALGVLILALAYIIAGNPFTAKGSVPVTNEYFSTTTFALSVAERTLRTGQGSLAQVTITGANTGLITIYNATTSNVNLRTGQKATSTITIADFPTNTAAGTYTFDAQYTDGLLVVTSGAPATSTITWR